MEVDGRIPCIPFREIGAGLDKAVETAAACTEPERVPEGGADADEGCREPVTYAEAETQTVLKATFFDQVKEDQVLRKQAMQAESEKSRRSQAQLIHYQALDLAYKSSFNKIKALEDTVALLQAENAFLEELDTHKLSRQAASKHLASAKTKCKKVAAKLASLGEDPQGPEVGERIVLP